MANWVRLRRQSHAPRELDGTETIYAAADGTLKHMDPEGSLSDLAGAGSLPSPTSEGDVLTVVEGEWAGAAPGGGSQPVTGVAIAFDTPNLFTQAFDITAVDLGAQTITIAGDHRTLFPAGVMCNVEGSSANDNRYLIASVALNTGNTIVTIDDTTPFTDDTADGKLINTGTAGVAIYTPEAGDAAILLADNNCPLLSTPEAFNATVDAHFSAMDFTNGEWSTYSGAFANADSFLDTHWAEPADALNAGSGGYNWLVFRDTHPFKIMLTGGSVYAPPDPLPTAGQGVIFMPIAKGPA